MGYEDSPIDCCDFVVESNFIEDFSISPPNCQILNFAVQNFEVTIPCTKESQHPSPQQSNMASNEIPKKATFMKRPS
jgi:hypothetical protein